MYIIHVMYIYIYVHECVGVWCPPWAYMRCMLPKADNASTDSGVQGKMLTYAEYGKAGALATYDWTARRESSFGTGQIIRDGESIISTPHSSQCPIPNNPSEFLAFMAALDFALGASFA